MFCPTISSQGQNVSNTRHIQIPKVQSVKSAKVLYYCVTIIKKKKTFRGKFKSEVIS